MQRKLIITTDPGQDQAAALMMILGQPQAFEVLGLENMRALNELLVEGIDVLKFDEDDAAEAGDIRLLAPCRFAHRAL